MNKTVKRLAMLATLAGSISASNNPFSLERTHTVEPEWKRKKCKSCKFRNEYNCARKKPTANACQHYSKK